MCSLKKDVMPARKDSKPVFLKFWFPVLLCMGFIFYTSSIPGRNIPNLFFSQDTIYHFFIYLILALFFIRALKNTYTNIVTAKAILLTILFAVFYGVTDELHQAFVPYRNVSFLDVFVDSVGGLAGSLIYRWLK